MLNLFLNNTFYLTTRLQTKGPSIKDVRSKAGGCEPMWKTADGEVVGASARQDVHKCNFLGVSESVSESDTALPPSLLHGRPDCKIFCVVVSDVNARYDPDVREQGGGCLPKRTMLDKGGVQNVILWSDVFDGWPPTQLSKPGIEYDISEQLILSMLRCDLQTVIIYYQKIMSIILHIVTSF